MLWEGSKTSPCKLMVTMFYVTSVYEMFHTNTQIADVEVVTLNKNFALLPQFLRIFHFFFFFMNEHAIYIFITEFCIYLLTPLSWYFIVQNWHQICNKSMLNWFYTECHTFSSISISFKCIFCSYPLPHLSYASLIVL